MVCRKCGYRTELDENLVLSESFDHSRDKTVVADGKRYGASAAVLCPKCGYLLAKPINPRKGLYRCAGPDAKRVDTLISTNAKRKIYIYRKGRNIGGKKPWYMP